MASKAEGIGFTSVSAIASDAFSKNRHNNVFYWNPLSSFQFCDPREWSLGIMAALPCLPEVRAALTQLQKRKWKMSFQITDDNGGALDAHFDVDRADIILHSRSGARNGQTRKNSDYRHA